MSSLRYFRNKNRNVADLRYNGPMFRSAVIQARVRPEIKCAGERVLKGLGLTMTELMELTLRRLIVDQKLPFEPVALDERHLAEIDRAWQAHVTKTAQQKSQNVKLH